MSVTMQLPWPSLALSEENRVLQGRVNQAADVLEEKRGEVAVHHEVLDLMMRQNRQLQQSIKASTCALNELQRTSQRGEEELRQVTQDSAIYRSEVQKLRRQQVQLKEFLSKSERALRGKEMTLSQQEQEVVSVFQALEQYQQMREEQAAEYKDSRHSEKAQRLQQLQASLRRAQEALDSSKSALERERDEHARLQREIASLRLDIERGKQDKMRSSLAVRQLKEAIEMAEAQTIANTDAYARGQETASDRRSLFGQLKEELEELRRKRERLEKAVEGHLRERDSQGVQLRAVEVTVEKQELDVVVMQRQLAMQHDVVRQLALQRNNALVLRDELRIRLNQLLLRYTEVKSVLDGVQESSDGNVEHNMKCLAQVLAAMQAGENKLDSQINRLSGATASCLSQLQEHARSGERLDGDVARARRALAAADRDCAEQKELRKIRDCELCALVSQLEDWRRRLQGAREAKADHFRLQRVMMEGTVHEMRERLQHHERYGLELRQGITSLRCSLSTQYNVLRENEDQLSRLSEEMILRGAEMERLGKERVQVGQKRQTMTLALEQATLQLQSLNRVADSQVSERCGAAGMKEVMLGQAMAVEEALQTELKNGILLLHLEHRAVMDKQTELRRHEQRLSLLKERYQDLMQTISQRVAMAAGEEARGSVDSFAGASTQLLNSGVDSLGAHAEPETLHAKRILLSSTTREQLWHRGNQLDARIVFLERETAALRKMRDLMRLSVSQKGNAVSSTTSKEQNQRTLGEKQTLVLAKLREGLSKTQKLVEVDLEHARNTLVEMRARMRQLNEQQQVETRRLRDMRALRADRQAALRRLQYKMRCERRSQHMASQSKSLTSPVCGR
uniref:Uncharacterized protein n=1 Tax=Trypanosoma vivax (strain Y486) TaxID=1055687 RepID=G0TVA7_TRYVY|nr:conserved hypothetical protein [Trypanosoma vivax Y486]